TAREMPAGAVRNTALVVAVAAQSGAAAAIREAASSFSDGRERRQALEAAGGLLGAPRLYPQGHAPPAGAAQGDASAAVRARADLIGKMRMHEQLKLPETDPKAVVERFLIASAGGDARTATELFTRAGRARLSSIDDKQAFTGMMRELRNRI